MATLGNTFETGIADGTLITISNSNDFGAGDGFNFVSAAGCEFDTALALHGARSALLSAPLGTDTAAFRWDSSFTPTAEYWGRQYFRVSDATPTTSFAILNGRDGTGATAYEVQLRTTGKLQIRIPTTVRYSASVATIAADTWYRMEVHAKCPSSTQVAVEVRLFYGSNLEGPIPDETIGDINTAFTTGNGLLSSIGFGIVSVTGQTSYTMLVDSVGFSDSSWLGSINPPLAPSPFWGIRAGEGTFQAPVGGFGFAPFGTGAFGTG